MAEVAEKVSHKQEKIGHVISTRAAKTIVVEVTRRVPHPVYKRIINKRKKFYAHDEQSQAAVGDFVRIVESRPLSRMKRWTLGEILRKAVQVGVEPSALDITPDGGKPATRKRRR